ncbi:MAG TPA: PDZ domain-containing protein [Candidatus Hydrogenedentes bacterium]|nr:PDZ domain-containing protein [Candidatus Hydrogenedentota bacterium]HPG68452.1 PDZ domain-containing protein [Candidatus Hydrogenedentota bacterium]
MLATASLTAWGEELPEALRVSVEQAAARVKPSLVRIHVVYTDYSDGRELKNESVGSGTVITKEGHVLTNHHVAGHATRLLCTFSNKEEFEAELVGTDPLTDIAVVKLLPEEPRAFPVAEFGDSDRLYVGQYVLAMGCPMALSHSVTLGIASNTEMVIPDWYGAAGAFTLDGEDVGALVRWIAHDAEIYGGNSGGPLVNLDGAVVGVNEIRFGLGGAIPGNLARSVAQELIANGKVKRSWIGLDVQPLLDGSGHKSGVLVRGTIEGSPAAEAGLASGDILVRVGDAPVLVQFPEEMPQFNLRITNLPVGTPVDFAVLRNEEEKTFAVTPIEREAMQPKEHELKPWGITARDLSIMDVKERKRDSRKGVLITSVRPGGPAGEAKPPVRADDILVAAGDTEVADLEALRAVTAEIGKDGETPVPVLTRFDRKNEDYLTVVRVGISEIPDPALQVKKAWLSVETQVLTREIAEALGRPDLTGFRVTDVYADTAADKAGLGVGDVIMAVDGEKLTASAPEHIEELPALIRQYRIGTTAQLSVLRGEEELAIPVELVAAPQAMREMKRYLDENFEFTVRNVSFFDRAREKWADDQKGVMVDEVKPGGWAALGQVNVGDLVLAVDDQAINDVKSFEDQMKVVAEAKPAHVVLKVLRGIHVLYVELKPKWETDHE